MKNTPIDDLRLVLTMRGRDYTFTSVTTSDYNDPLVKDLFGSPQGYGKGIVTTQGITSSVALSYQCYEVPRPVLDLMFEVWKNSERVELKLIGRNSRESRRATNAIITTNPRNGTTQEGAEANAVSLGIAVTRNNINDEVLS